MRISIVPERGERVILESPRNGVYGQWVKDDGFSGWYGTPAPREGPTTRSGLDSDLFPSRLTKGSRTVTIDVYALYKSSVEAARVTDIINDLSGQRLKMTVEDSFGRRHASGIVVDDPNPMLGQKDCEITYTLIISFPDSRKYEDPIAYHPEQGECIVINKGNADTYPCIEAEDVTHLRMEIDGHVVEWEGEVESLSLDLRNAICSAGELIEDDICPISPGAHAVSLTSDASSVKLLVSSAWK